MNAQYLNNISLQYVHYFAMTIPAFMFATITKFTLRICVTTCSYQSSLFIAKIENSISQTEGALCSQNFQHSVVHIRICLGGILLLITIRNCKNLMISK